MWKQLKPAFLLVLVLTLLTGAAYPALVTGLAQLLMPQQANGSLIVQGGKVVGSRLVGQQWEGPHYFWGRLSATSPVPYNGANSGGSNYGPLNPALKEAVQACNDVLGEWIARFPEQWMWLYPRWKSTVGD